MGKGAKTTDDYRDAGGVLNKKYRAHYEKSLKSNAEYYGEMAGMAFETAIWGAGASVASQYVVGGFDVSAISAKKVGYDILSYGLYGSLLGGTKPLTKDFGNLKSTVATNLLFIPSAVMQGVNRGQSAGEIALNYGIGRPVPLVKNYWWGPNSQYFQPTQVMARFVVLGITEWSPFSSYFD